MNNKIINILETIEKFTIYITVFLYPLIVLSLFTNIFETPKLLLLFVSLIIIGVIKITKLFLRKTLEIKVSKFDAALGLLTSLFVLSGIFASPNMIDSFFLPGAAGFITLSYIFYISVNQLKDFEKKNVLNILLASGFVLSIVQIFTFFGITKVLNFLPDFAKSQAFTPSGNIVSTLVIIVSFMPILIFKIFTKSDSSEKVLSILVSIVFLVAISTSIYNLLPGKETSIKLLKYNLGWSIAIDSLKTNPLLGVGPSEFSIAFNQFRPITYNQTADWNLKYLQNSSTFLTIFTEVGILGLVATIIFLLVLFKAKQVNNPLFVSIAVFVLALVFLPVSVPALLVLFLLLTVFSETQTVKFGESLSNINQVLRIIPSIVILSTFVYFGGRAFFAEFIFSNSLKSISKGNGVSAYELVNKAVSINPYSDRYHLLSASINLGLAENLSNKIDITEEDKQTVSQLIQQAIREGKAAVSVNPRKSTNWEALSGIYQTIMAFAKGADEFAVGSMAQAINLDPINPNLRIRLGSLYYSLQRYDQSIEVLKLAVLAKPDYPNSYYNLAILYKENKQLDKAKETMNYTLSLLGKESADYEKALKELQNIEELTKPQEAPEPAIEPQLELPQEAGLTVPEEQIDDTQSEQVQDPQI